MRKDDPTRPPSRKLEMLPDYERRWNVATAQLLSYVPFDVVKELREIAEGWAHQRAVALAGNGIGLLDEIERKAITSAWLRNANNVVATAHELGISKQTLYRKLKQYELL